MRARKPACEMSGQFRADHGAPLSAAALQGAV
jgi:hypothetical protein